MTKNAWVITGPTSGMGHVAALELAAHGTVVLVGRDRKKLDGVSQEIAARGGSSLTVVCDMADLTSVRRAAAEITALGLPIRGVLNNAGISPTRATKNAAGWDLTFTTNHLGPFLFTELLVPHLADGTHVVFVASAVEDPDRKPARLIGMRGGRYISAEASARGEWEPGGSTLPGADGYSTSKQALLAAALAFARETPRLRFDAVEPGITPGTGLARDAGAFLGLVVSAMTYLPPFGRYRSTPERAGRLLAKVLVDESKSTGVYYDEKGEPMQASPKVRDASFQDRVVSETRAFLRAHS